MPRCRRSAATTKLLTRLVPITKVDHPRLSDCGRRAKQLVHQLTAERNERRNTCGEAYKRARQCFEAFDFDGAAAAMAEVPPALQHESAEELRAAVASRREEIAKLTEEVREAVRQRRLLELPEKIERLLSLKPDHAMAKKLAEQVHDSFLRAAEKHLAARQYQDAHALLSQIDPHVRTPQTQELFQRAAELAWLDWDLRKSPVIDKTLLGVAERLRRLAPDDARVVKLLKELHRRSGGDGPSRGGPLTWARPPQPTALGLPVEWLAGLGRLTCAAGMDQIDLLRYPGRFVVAGGLALAGIKQDALRINLFSDEQRGMLRRVTRLVRPRSTRRAWGIDVGASGLKAVKLAWDEAEEQAVVEVAVSVDHAKSLRHAANEEEEETLVKQTVQAFLDRHQTQGERVCVGLPGRMALCRQLELPPTDQGKVSRLVHYEAQQQFPFALDQMAWDFDLLRCDGGQSNDAANGPGIRAY